MKRSALLAGLMVLAAASSAAAQVRSSTQRPIPARPAVAVAQSVCPAGSYSVVQAPDGTTVSVLFHQFTVEADGVAPQTQRSRCRIQIPLAVPAGYSAALASVDYRGFAQLGHRQSGEISVDYEIGQGNRGPRFQRRLQGAQSGDFSFTDRLPPGRLRQAGCGARGTPPSILAIDAALTLTTTGAGEQAMISLDSADQSSTGALRYRFNVRACDRNPTALVDQ